MTFHAKRCSIQTFPSQRGSAYVSRFHFSFVPPHVPPAPRLGSTTGFPAQTAWTGLENR
jgi:hypothetical protein